MKLLFVGVVLVRESSFSEASSQFGGDQNTLVSYSNLLERLAGPFGEIFDEEGQIREVLYYYSLRGRSKCYSIRFVSGLNACLCFYRKLSDLGSYQVKYAWFKGVTVDHPRALVFRSSGCEQVTELHTEVARAPVSQLAADIIDAKPLPKRFDEIKMVLQNMVRERHPGLVEHVQNNLYGVEQERKGGTIEYVFRFNRMDVDDIVFTFKYADRRADISPCWRLASGLNEMAIGGMQQLPSSFFTCWFGNPDFAKGEDVIDSLGVAMFEMMRGISVLNRMRVNDVGLGMSLANMTRLSKPRWYRWKERWRVQARVFSVKIYPKQIVVPRPFGIYGLLIYTEACLPESMDPEDCAQVRIGIRSAQTIDDIICTQVRFPSDAGSATPGLFRDELTKLLGKKYLGDHNSGERQVLCERVSALGLIGDVELKELFDPPVQSSDARSDLLGGFR